MDSCSLISTRNFSQRQNCRSSWWVTYITATVYPSTPQHLVPRPSLHTHSTSLQAPHYVSSTCPLRPSPLPDLRTLYSKAARQRYSKSKTRPS